MNGGRIGRAPANAVTPLWVAAGLAMAPAVSMALGRFAYALLLPEMRTELEWSYTEAGPVLSGLISDGGDGVRAGLLLSIAVLTISVVAAPFQREAANEQP